MSTSQGKYRVSIVDDHPFFAQGFKKILEAFEPVQVVDTYYNVEELIAQMDDKDPHIVFMDIYMKEKMNGIDATLEILKRKPDLIVIAVSMANDGETVQRMLQAGAKGYLTKDLSTEILEEVFCRIAKGDIYIAQTAAENCIMHSMHSPDDILPGPETIPSESAKTNDLSERSLKIIKMLAAGNTDKEIAHHMGITKKMVEYEKGKIYKKLDVKNVAAMITMAFRLKLIS